MHKATEKMGQKMYFAIFCVGHWETTFIFTLKIHTIKYSGYKNINLVQKAIWDYNEQFKIRCKVN